MMSEQKVPRSVEQRIVIKFLGEKSRPLGKSVSVGAGVRVEVVASLSQGRTAAAQCGLFTHKSVPVIVEPPCIIVLCLQHKLQDLPKCFQFTRG